jgi:hypothetical protein
MGITLLVIPGMDPTMVVQGRTTAEDMPVTRAPSQLRLAIGRIIRMAPGITSGGPITCGGRDTGHGATVEASGSAGTTW